MAQNGNKILFYSTIGEYGCFSNFSRHQFEINGVVWRTSEHYFQAMKTDDPVKQEAIRLAPTPAAAAKMGRDRRLGLRADWDAIRDDVMMTALRAKFTAHDAIKRILVSTGTCEIVEHTAKDRYWADGGDGTGQNRLGLLLMQLRAEFIAEAQRVNAQVVAAQVIADAQVDADANNA
ncbi:putative DNA repair ATPase [Faustovirus]|nr:putative DNA repair ATPase [Faustovirus]QJX73544.1 N-glycosidase YbiA [Faustovirus]